MNTIRQIARGGFGVVSEVEDSGGNRLALKTFSPPPGISPALQDKARQRFIREVKIQEGLTHPNILPILSADLHADPPTFLMPLADETYTDQIKRDRAVGTVTLAPLLDILAGLEELHRLGYVHRDLKPQNVLKIGGSWMISDFGLAVPPDRGTTKVTSTGEAWGTEFYMPPEQVTDFRAASPQADIYAFGCILHDVAGTSGRLPYHQHTCPGPLGRVIERCTDFDPDDRFPSISALRSALVGALHVPAAVATTPQAIHWVDRLTNHAEQMARDEWRDLVVFLDNHPDEKEVTAVLEVIDIPQIEAVYAIAPPLFLRVADALAEWIQDGGFQWDYCDVLAARLMRLYELGGVSTRAAATIAALQMGCNHNRWHVMRTFVRMADPTIPEDLADRLAVEFFALDADAIAYMNQIERALRIKVKLHPKLAAALDQIRASRPSTASRTSSTTLDLS